MIGAAGIGAEENVPRYRVRQFEPLITDPRHARKILDINEMMDRVRRKRVVRPDQSSRGGKDQRRKNGRDLHAIQGNDSTTIDCRLLKRQSKW